MEELKEVQSLQCHLVVPSSGEHPGTSRTCLFLLPHHFLHLGLFQCTQTAPLLSCFSSWSVRCLMQELLFIALDILVDVSDSPTDTPLEGSVVSLAVSPDHLNKETPSPHHLGPVSWAGDKRAHIDSAWKLSLWLSPTSMCFTFSSTSVWGWLCRQAEAFLRCGLLSRECGKHSARAGPDVAKPRQRHLPRPTDVQPHCTSLANSAWPQCTAFRGWWPGTRPRHLSCWPW